MSLVKYIKIFVIVGTLLLSIFMFWLFAPMVNSINSVGKDFFLVDKTNITLYVRSRLLSAIKELNLVDELGEIKSAVLNESRNKNIGEMTVYDPNLPIETEADRLVLDKPFQATKEFTKYINSASVMIPAPNVNEVATYFKKNPDIDLGLHLTFWCNRFIKVQWKEHHK